MADFKSVSTQLPSFVSFRSPLTTTNISPKPSVNKVRNLPNQAKSVSSDWLRKRITFLQLQQEVSAKNKIAPSHRPLQSNLQKHKKLPRIM